MIFEVKTSITAFENLGGGKLVLWRDQHAIVVVYLYICRMRSGLRLGVC